MKKVLNIVMLSVIAVLVVCMVTHVTLSFISISNDLYTSAPASIAFLLAIPYLVAIAVCVVVWLIIKRSMAKKKKVV